MKDAVIELKNVSKQIDHDEVLRDVCFTLLRGETHLIWGENGAGKSMLLRVICGVCPFDAGEITIYGQVYHRCAPPPYSKASAIAMLPQENGLIAELTVFQNLFLNRRLWFVNEERYFLAHVPEAMKPLVSCLIPVLGWKVRHINNAQRQVLQIAKTVMFGKDILFFDEPLVFLNNYERGLFLNVLNDLRARGKSLIIITHCAEQLVQYGDRISIIKNGQVLSTVEKAAFATNELIRDYSEAHTLAAYPKLRHAPGEMLLEAEHMSGGSLHNVSLQVRCGEVVGITGSVSSGKSELPLLLLGGMRRLSGVIRVYGVVRHVRNPSEAIREGIYYLPANRDNVGMFLQQDISFNIAGTDASGQYQTGEQIRTIAVHYMNRLRIHAKGPAVKVNRLSNGNRKKVLISRALANHSSLYIFDEPTAGLDKASQNEVYNIINHLTLEGSGVILVSANFAELSAMCDRVYFMRDGRVNHVVERRELSPERLYLLCTSEEGI